MNNYKRIYIGKNENGNSIFEDEHRKIMEQHLGRKLKGWEVVHHINHDKSDNRIENLRVMSRSDHAKLHSIGRKISDEQKEKLRSINLHKINANRSKTKEDIIAIVKKYKELKSYRKVDKFFGFSNGTTGTIIRGEIYYDYQDIIKQILNM